MADQQEVKATDEKAPEKPKQQEAPVEKKEVADETSEQPPKEMRAVLFTGTGGLQYVKVAVSILFRRGVLSAPLYQRHVCAYLDVYT
jgi:outer membrane biosynthesis protein TonB